MTSDERREMAEQLRKHNGRYYEELVNMSDSDLADLIDPTCEVESVEPIRAGEFNQAIGSAFHLTCGHTAWRACTDEPPVYCEECGARVVSDDDQ